ncbi:MAG: Trm112 family protein [Planctomycetes bacterium]|nr:Trm112 family protein [Planctomycetota bacterium]
MKEALLPLLACPDCRGVLRLARAARVEEAEVLEGVLACAGCRREYSIVRGVPRFAGESAAVASFGFEWLRHARVQYDRDGDPRSSREFFKVKTPWSPESIAGKTVLDTFDWLSPMHQAYDRWPEVFAWFRENGFTEIGLQEPGITMYGTKKK